ncbi:unnamed protein product [Amoebophrya sp. A120]|nr:unnamed protein product [Amoebophrya sp. A120]|eukprot:GSA120T00017061001.1
MRMKRLLLLWPFATWSVRCSGEKVVMKFGGSSLKDSKKVLEVAQIVNDKQEMLDKVTNKPHELLVICSAMGKTTDALRELYKTVRAERDAKVDPVNLLASGLGNMKLHHAAVNNSSVVVHLQPSAGGAGAAYPGGQQGKNFLASTAPKYAPAGETTTPETSTPEPKYLALFRQIVRSHKQIFDEIKAHAIEKALAEIESTSSQENLLCRSDTSNSAFDDCSACSPPASRPGEQGAPELQGGHPREAPSTPSRQLDLRKQRRADKLAQCFENAWQRDIEKPLLQKLETDLRAFYESTPSKDTAGMMQQERDSQQEQVASSPSSSALNSNPQHFSSDYVLSFGERLAVRIVAHTLRTVHQQKLAAGFDSWALGLQTTSGNGELDSVHSSATIDDVDRVYQNIREGLESQKMNLEGVCENSLEDCSSKPAFIPIVTGYIARDSQGRTTTLGRDGSDFSAALFGAAIDANRVQIYKDVPGIQSADPRSLGEHGPQRVRTIPFLTYDQAAELALHGATVVHPRATDPLRAKGIPLEVRGTSDPFNDATFTTIGRTAPSALNGELAASLDDQERTAPELSSSAGTTPTAGKSGGVAADETSPGVLAITWNDKARLIRVESSEMVGASGFLSEVFGVFKEFGISLDVVGTSTSSVSMTTDGLRADIEPKLVEAQQVLQQKFKNGGLIEIDNNVATLTLIVADPTKAAEVMWQVQKVLCEHQVPLEIVTKAKSLQLTFVISTSNGSWRKAIDDLHTQFVEGKLPVAAATTLEG